MHPGRMYPKVAVFARFLAPFMAARPQKNPAEAGFSWLSPAGAWPTERWPQLSSIFGASQSIVPPALMTMPLPDSCFQVEPALCSCLPVVLVMISLAST